MSFEEKQVRAWITGNRGILTSIALACDVTPQFVQQAAYGKSTSVHGNGGKLDRVEAEMRDKGWPGCKRRRKKYA